jgi:hypothetical protein
VDGWVAQAGRHGLNSELIVVAWNPTALRWPDETSRCRVRVIEVPRETPPAIAKNAGIRRARGEFILATDIGIVFSDELMEFLASRRLDPGRLYRIDRYDVEGDVPVGLHAREGSFPLTPDGLRRNAADDITSADSGLNFGPGWFPAGKYPAAGETFRWIHNDAEILARVPDGGGILLLEVEPGPGLALAPQPIQVIDDRGSQVGEWNIEGRTTLALAVPSAAGGTLRTFHLHVPGGGAPVLDDARILNLAVFRCDWPSRIHRGPSRRPR